MAFAPHLRWGGDFSLVFVCVFAFLDENVFLWEKITIVPKEALEVVVGSRYMQQQINSSRATAVKCTECSVEMPWSSSQILFAKQRKYWLAMN